MTIKKILTKKNIIYFILGLIIISGAYFLFFNKKNTQQTLVVHPGDFLQQVSASGTISPKDNLDLSFEQAGQVTGVYAKVSDKVFDGQLLVSQNAGELQAQSSQMQAGIDLEQAKLDQLLAGASDEDIKTAQDSVDLAQQNLDNAYASSINALNAAYTTMYNAYTTVSYVQRQYFNGGDQESFQVQANKGIINDNVQEVKKYLDVAGSSLNTNDKDTAILKTIVDLNNVYNSLAVIREQCEQGVYYSTVTAADKASLDTQKININTSISTVTSAKSSIALYQTDLFQAQDTLNLKKSPARSSDIAVYKAQIEQAKASLQNVLAQLGKKRIYSPINGIVTAVNAKTGSVISSNDIAVSVISNNNFQVESFIPEINISLIKIGQDADVTLDSYGDTVFKAKVLLIDPAQTVKDGVSTYKVTLEFIDNNDTRIKSGMTGNIIITTLQKSNVISVPQGIVGDENSQKFVMVKNGDATVKTVIETGAVASNGNIEVTSGLKDGDIVILK